MRTKPLTADQIRMSLTLYPGTNRLSVLIRTGAGYSLHQIVAVDNTVWDIGPAELVMSGGFPRPFNPGDGYEVYGPEGEIPEGVMRNLTIEVPDYRETDPDYTMRTSLRAQLLALSESGLDAVYRRLMIPRNGGIAHADRVEMLLVWAQFAGFLKLSHVQDAITNEPKPFVA